MRNDSAQMQAEALGVECALPAGYPSARSAPNAARGRAPKIATALLLTCLGAGLWEFGQGIYIHAKARFSQFLIADAWNNFES